jgi:hypothetical protein
MARTLEELDRALNTLTEDVDRLRQERSDWREIVRQYAGCFTNDADWAAIHERIEEERRQPDPDLAGP